MDLRAYYRKLQASRKQLAVTRDALLELQAEWTQYALIPVRSADPLGEDLYEAYNLMHTALQKLPNFDVHFNKDGHFAPEDGTDKFVKWAESLISGHAGSQK